MPTAFVARPNTYCNKLGFLEKWTFMKAQPAVPTPGPLSIVYLPIDQLRPDPGNARQHTRKQIRQIARSIATFGFNVPILIDRDGTVIAGHGRLAAAMELGWAEVPTIRLDHLSEAQKKAFMIADNRLAEVAVWDDRLLAEQLKALASVELSFDLETIGFDMGEIDLRIESLKGEATKEPPRNFQFRLSQATPSLALATSGCSVVTGSCAATLATGQPIAS